MYICLDKFPTYSKFKALMYLDIDKKEDYMGI